MLVELDVFSGRPNPRWALDGHASQQLRELAKRLTSTRQAPADPPGLGYRGFVYSDAAGRARVYKGLVATDRGTFADPAFSIERFLLEQIPAEYAALRPDILSDLQRGR